MAIQEIALTESRSLRQQYAGRTDVLDKVKALALLPDGTHVTTEMVASYYEVDDKTIEKLAERNRDELEANGYHVLEGKRLADFKSVCGISSRARSLALFSRRAVLNVGQLLRDSLVAQQVRTYLLDAESEVKPRLGDDLLYELEVSNDRTARAIGIAKSERARADHLEQRAEVAEDKMRQIEGGDGLTLTAFHKKYFSDVRETDFFAHLYAKKYLIDQRGKGLPRANGTRRDGPEHRHPSYLGKPYFYLHDGGIYGGKRRPSTRVRPGQPELDLKAALAKDGLPVNEHRTGHLFAIEGTA